MSKDNQIKIHEVLFVTIQYVTSVGLSIFQVMFIVPVTFLLYLRLDTGPSLLEERIITAFFHLPLLSVIGIVLAIICIKRRESVVLSCIGLSLNCMYLLVFFCLYMRFVILEDWWIFNL